MSGAWLGLSAARTFDVPRSGWSVGIIFLQQSPPSGAAPHGLAAGASPATAALQAGYSIKEKDHSRQGGMPSLTAHSRRPRWASNLIEVRGSDLSVREERLFRVCAPMSCQRHRMYGTVPHTSYHAMPMACPCPCTLYLLYGRTCADSRTLTHSHSGSARARVAQAPADPRRRSPTGTLS